MTERPALTLLVPGLLGPVTGMPGGQLIPAQAPFGLCGLIGKAQVELFEERIPERAVLALMGYRCGDELPAGILGYRADAGRMPSTPVLQADPTHLQAGSDGVVQYDDDRLAVQSEEAAVLVGAFNQQFGAEGYRLEAVSPHRWYLFLPRHYEVCTQPLSVTLGRSVRDALPSGRDGRKLRSLLTEIQMFLHQQAVNQERECLGRPSINSLWLWGAAMLPSPPPRTPWTRLWGDNVLLRGAGEIRGLPWAPLPEDVAALYAEPGNALAVIEEAMRPALYGDIEQWLQAVAHIDRQWISPLIKALGAGRLSALTLLALDGRRYRLLRRHRLRFWRRPPPFATLIADGR